MYCEYIRSLPISSHKYLSAFPFLLTHIWGVPHTLFSFYCPAPLWSGVHPAVWLTYQDDR